MWTSFFASFRKSVLLTSGTLLNSLLGLVFYIWVGRSLSVSDFGYFSFLLGVGLLLADLGDWGLGASLIKFSLPEKINSVFTLAVYQRILVGILFLIISLLSQLIYPANFLLSALIAWFLLALYLVMQYLLAKQNYLLYVLVNILGNSLRLGIVYLLVQGHLLSSFTALGAFILGNIFALILGTILIALVYKSLPLIKIAWREVFSDLRSFTPSLGLSYSLAALASRLDNPIIFFLSGPSSAGIYSASQRLSSVFPQVAGSVEGVFSPRFSQNADYKIDFRNYLITVGLLSLILVCAIPFTQTIITLTFGAKYLPSVGVLQILLLSMSALLLTSPFAAVVLYRFGKANWHLISSLLQIVLSLLLYFLLVPQFGATGAALTSLIVAFVNLIMFITLFYVFSHKS